LQNKRPSGALRAQGAVWLADIAVAEFGLKQATALFILAVMSLFLIFIHLGFASATALAAAMIPIVIAVLQGVATPGINIVGMTMLLQFVVSFGFILVVNAPQNMVAYGTETFAARDFVRTGLVLTVIAFALIRATPCQGASCQPDRFDVFVALDWKKLEQC
jgi:di/tricarboxylate transporter